MYESYPPFQAEISRGLHLEEWPTALGLITYAKKVDIFKTTSARRVWWTAGMSARILTQVQTADDILDQRAGTLRLVVTSRTPPEPRISANFFLAREGMLIAVNSASRCKTAKEALNIEQQFATLASGAYDPTFAPTKKDAELFNDMVVQGAMDRLSTNK